MALPDWSNCVLRQPNNIIQEREALVSKTSQKEALDHAIVAAELYMKAANAATTPEEKQRLNKKCRAMILQAEHIKKTGHPEGIVILLRNSRLNGNIFPPWDSDLNDEDFSGAPFSDPTNFNLSPRQNAVFSGWKRPLEILGQEEDSGTLMEAQHDYDLVQDITTDCSVVASLCASIPHLKPGPSSILAAHMFPSNPENGQPKISANGKYVFRMYFNGCWRKVVIDDRLPSSSTDRLLYVVDRQNPRLIWPALIEKAYLKVRGGYDFPGSNSGTDLYALAGWIPEQVFIQNENVDWDRVWKRVKKAYDYGDVAVTLGTGRFSPEEEETLGLAGEHNYAVLNIVETPTGSRRLLVKNPWCEGLVWKGVGSSDITPSEATDDHPVKLKPGSFWISFDDVTQNFESLYLNWNPGLFTERQDHHFTWVLPHPTMITSFAYSPQYSMTAADDDNTWILLSRHFQDGEMDIMRNQRAATNNKVPLADIPKKIGFMSIYVFANHEGKRVQLSSSRPVYRGDYVDSPETLVPFEAKRGVRYTVVVATAEPPLPQYSFTLSFFSRSALTVAKAEPPRKSYVSLKSSWTRRTAGGNAAAPTYLQNPQFSLELPRASPLSLLLSTGREDLPVHVALVWARGHRVTAVRNRDLVLTSGDYRREGALAEVPLVDAGTYTIVCSTFQPGCFADFTLRVGSDVPCKLRPVLPDAAGMLRTRLSDLSTSTTSTESETHKKTRASLSTPRLTRASIIVTQSTSQSTTTTPAGVTTPRARPTIRATVEYGTGPDRYILASTDTDTYLTRNTASGEFREVGVNGLRTSEFDINAPSALDGCGLWLVVEQLGSADPGAGLQVEVLSESPVYAGSWEAVDD
ncbi:hypothetical protein M426DRAFT_52247 [Hypoxylon sp. CI-4A]|nr:hypothetical protein M426DRAFT_52247 [Hypoxylon sp. CI-4A]